MTIEEVVANHVCTVYRGQLRGKACLLVKTGIGKKRAENATQHVLDHYPVNALLSLGFAGALVPDLKAGDVVVCSTLHCASGFNREGSEPAAYATDSTLYDLALQGPRGGAIRFSLGNSVTVPQVVSGPQRKQELSRDFQAQIVDMESYWIARMASARQLPFLAIRSISDTLQDDLQPLDHILDSEGRLLWKRVVPYFLLHPHHFASVLAAFSNMRLAERHLTSFISELVTRIRLES